MKKRESVLAFSFILLLFFLAVNLQALIRICYAQIVSGSELINNAKSYDGQRVVYSGEVIGDVMARGENCWVNAYDGSVAVGIWMDAPAAERIFYTGSYKSNGDIIEVDGVFHRACREHGGDLDIHGESLRVVVPGGDVIEKLDSNKKNTAIIFLGVLCVIWILSLLKRK